jgi:hypothetical protein
MRSSLPPTDSPAPRSRLSLNGPYVNQRVIGDKRARRFESCPGHWEVPGTLPFRSRCWRCLGWSSSAIAILACVSAAGSSPRLVGLAGGVFRAGDAGLVGEHDRLQPVAMAELAQDRYDVRLEGRAREHDPGTRPAPELRGRPAGASLSDAAMSSPCWEVGSDASYRSAATGEETATCVNEPPFTVSATLTHFPFLHCRMLPLRALIRVPSDTVSYVPVSA